MLVPAAINVPSRGGSFITRLNHVTNRSPAAIAQTTTGMPHAPSQNRRAGLDADENDAEPQQLAHANFTPGLRAAAPGTQQHADEDRDRDTRDRLVLPVESMPWSASRP
jgi:hypothetical protein